MSNIEAISDSLNQQTRLIWIESPSNPLLQVVDIQEIVKKSKKKNALVAVDNTFLSPSLQNPLKLGADIVMHSATKYLAGHSDVVLGALMLNDDDLAERLYFIQNATGAVPGPQDCFLTLRGIKTLHVRMQRHCENCREIAQFLQKHKKIDKVYWPGFKTHPNHEVAKEQMNGFSGMICFELTGGIPAGKTVMNSVELAQLAESLGSVETMITHPATMTHAEVPKEDRLARGLTDGLVRISVGIENIDDIIQDLSSALEKC